MAPQDERAKELLLGLLFESRTVPALGTQYTGSFFFSFPPLSL